MLKWSPEPFDVEPANRRSPVVDAAAFESNRNAAAAVGGADEGARQFRREAGFTDSKSLMGSLTQDERRQVYELVELELSAEYQAREAALQVEFERRLAEAKEETRLMVDVWTSQIADVFSNEIKQAASASARLAVRIAEKILRSALAVDPEPLVRVIETTLFKTSGDEPLTIQVNPVDAAWLEGQPGLRERLNIGQIVPDRRIEQGGTLIRCGNREWDATLRRQLETLDEVVNEMIATGEALPPELPAYPPAMATELQPESTPAADPENDHALDVE